MPSSEGFVQGYNAQAAVDIDSHLIVAEHVSDHTNDKQELAPALRCLDERQEAVGQPRALLADAGYFSDENVRRCEAEGIEPYIASGRERHHRPLADRLAPVPECPAQADGVAAMGHRMKNPRGQSAVRQAQVHGGDGLWSDQGGVGIPTISSAWARGGAGRVDAGVHGMEPEADARGRRLTEGFKGRRPAHAYCTALIGGLVANLVRVL